MERLLRYRRLIEERQAQALAQAGRRLQTSREALSRADALLLSARATLCAQRAQPQQARELMLFEGNENALRRRRRECAASAEAEAEAYEQERQATLRAWRQRTIVERVRSRHLRRLREEELKEEQKTIDELATIASARRGRAR